MRSLLVAAMVLAVPTAAGASTAPTSAVFHDPTTRATCAATGKTGSQDPVENSLKNRITMPATTTPTTVAEFRNLPEHAKTARSNWTAAELQQFGQLEKQGVRIQGYLLGVKPEGAESTNCGAVDAQGIDYHMWLVDAADKTQGRDFSAVVEVTPRWRQANPGWSCPALTALVTQGALVRISGWRLFDYEHPEQLPSNNSTNPTRSTLWEIHPITKIEVATTGGWVEPGATSSGAAKTLTKAKKGAKPTAKSTSKCQ